MKNITAVCKKQMIETFRNITVLIQFLMFPLLTVIMTQAVQIKGMPENFFVSLFSVMYIGMAPLTSMAAIIAEEKEKGTLRVLILLEVKPYEYFCGVGSYIWFSCMLGAGVICIVGGYTGWIAVLYLGIMAVGIIISMVIGAAIGTWSQNQMTATSLTIPVMLALSFLPMLAMFQTTFSDIGQWIYSRQLHLLLQQLDHLHITSMNLMVIIMNLIAACLLFVIAYRKSGLT